MGRGTRRAGGVSGGGEREGGPLTMGSTAGKGGRTAAVTSPTTAPSMSRMVVGYIVEGSVGVGDGGEMDVKMKMKDEEKDGRWKGYLYLSLSVLYSTRAYEEHIPEPLIARNPDPETPTRPERDVARQDR